MNDHQNLKKSIEGISYLDFSDFMEVPVGIVLKNKNHSIENLFNFILKKCHLEKTLKDHTGLSGLTNDENKNRLKITELDQKHTNIVLNASEKIKKPADGLYTSSANAVLVVKTADCFPVFFNDGVTVGLLHVGWRGCLTGIINNFFKEVNGFKLQQAKAAIGPGIGSCCFKVSPEVALLLDKKYRQFKKGNFYIDLQGLIVDELAENEIKYILRNDTCTVCNNEMCYSYRREGKDVKQMLSYICTGG